VRNGGEPLGVVRDAQKNRLIEFEVINQRIGISVKKKKVA